MKRAAYSCPVRGVGLHLDVQNRVRSLQRSASRDVADRCWRRRMEDHRAQETTVRKEVEVDVGVLLRRSRHVWVRHHAPRNGLQVERTVDANDEGVRLAGAEQPRDIELERQMPTLVAAGLLSVHPHVRPVVHRAEAQPDPFILPATRHTEGGLMPNATEVVPQILELVVPTGRHSDDSAP